MWTTGLLRSTVKNQAQLFLAWAFGAFGGYWEVRMRMDSLRAEADMAESPDELFYAQLYLGSIFEALPNRSGLRILDAGCQAGRLAIPLAQAGHSVTGVDISPHWIARCRAHCEKAAVQVDLICDDIGKAISSFAPGSFDAVVCTELLYTRRDFAAILKGFRRLLCEGGRMIASHRTPYYVLTTLVRYHQFAAAAEVLQREEGTIKGSYFNWFEENKLRRIYANAGLAVMETKGIGTLSGIGVDGLAAVVSPSDLSPEEQAELLRLEKLSAARYRHTARYLLFISEPTFRDRF